MQRRRVCKLPGHTQVRVGVRRLSPEGLALFRAREVKGMGEHVRAIVARIGADAQRHARLQADLQQIIDEVRDAA